MISIRNTMGWLAGLTIAAAGLFGGAAPAQAQQLVKFAEVESQGGFVAWSDKVTMLAQLNAAGRITGGRVQVERVVRRGATPGTLVMTGKMGAAETHSLWTAIYAAKPWQYTQVRARNGNTDFPNTKVTYMGRYAQTIIAGYITPPRLPLVSAEMERFTGLAWDLDRKTAEGDCFTYVANGGRAGYERAIKIAQSGAITVEVTYANPAFASQASSKQGQLSVDDMNALKRLCASWASYPRAFAGDPRTYDGIAVTAAFTLWGVTKQVFGGEPANQPASFKAVIAKVEQLADALP